jgi:hypothetical protein
MESIGAFLFAQFEINSCEGNGKQSFDLMLIKFEIL